jgi:hypothetical protein
MIRTDPWETLFMGDLIVNASLRTIVIVVAALLLVAASGWASTRSLSVHVAGGSGHYNLQPIW